MELDGFKDLEQQRQAREDFFEKSFDPTYIEKGKRGGAGEIREWKDGKYQKQSDGTWKPVKDGGGKSTKEDSGSLVGKKFNHEGLTYQVTKQGSTQSEAVAITESKKGKRITIDNKVVQKQAGSSKEEPKKSGQKLNISKILSDNNLKESDFMLDRGKIQDVGFGGAVEQLLEDFWDKVKEPKDWETGSEMREIVRNFIVEKNKHLKKYE